MTPRLGINNCFAIKRWPQPEDWGVIVREELGLDLVQHSFDLVDFSLSDDQLREEAARVGRACEQRGIELHSTFTGLIAYSWNLLLAPAHEERVRARRWYERAIAFSAKAGAAATGGHVGSLTVGDSLDAGRQALLWSELRSSLEYLSAVARRAGLKTFMVENMACAREPSTIAQLRELVSEPDPDHAEVALCLDIGHQCVPGTSGDDRDPYAWLKAVGGRAAVIHLQQSDAHGDHHWPFTARHNDLGRIDAARVLRDLAGAAEKEPVLILEVIPPFEEDDEQVLEDLRVSVEHWRQALHDAGEPLRAG